MDFLGVGVPELAVIIVLAIIFIGPRDMPKLAGRAAKFLRELRQMSDGFTTQWRREINAATEVEGLKELRDELAATQKSVLSINADIKSVTRPNLSSLASLAEPETPAAKPAETEASAAQPSVAPPDSTPTPSATEESTRRDN